jgi:hypothetical protein
MNKKRFTAYRQSKSYSTRRVRELQLADSGKRHSSQAVRKWKTNERQRCQTAKESLSSSREELLTEQLTRRVTTGRELQPEDSERTERWSGAGAGGCAGHLRHVGPGGPHHTLLHPTHQRGQG